MAKVTRTALTQLVVASLVLCSIVSLASSEALAAIYDTVMPYSYRNTKEGATYSGCWIFDSTGYTPEGEDYCEDDHRDPDGNKYAHAHLPLGFPFDRWNWITEELDTVTVTKSDWAWDAHYSGYTKSSSSTFVHNCFSHAVSAPTVTFYEGWDAFTDVVSLSLATSMADMSHAIKITVSYQPGCSSGWYVSASDEKNASSGTYEKTWYYPGKDTSGKTLGENK